MTPYYTDKANKQGTKRYHYYRCSNLSRKGWASCSIKQISADRFHDMLFQNLRRMSMDEEYLKNRVMAHENSFRNPPGVGFQPDLKEGTLTPQRLEEILKEFLNICARMTGMERYLSIRRHLAGIGYSKKTVSVEFFLGGPKSESENDFARPTDGKSLLNQRPTPAAPRAAPAFGTSARTLKSDLPLPAPPTKKPGPFWGPDLNGGLDSTYMVLGTGLEPVTPSMSRRYSNQLS